MASTTGHGHNAKSLLVMLITVNGKKHKRTRKSLEAMNAPQMPIVYKRQNL